MFKKIAIVIVVLIGAVLAFATTRPNALHVQRETTVNASPEEIFPLIADFHRWSSWSPFEKMDPGMKRTYDGSARGVGAVYQWDGNSQAGQGRMEITEASEPSRVAITLDFTKPLEGHDVATFTLTPDGHATRVVWTMDGPTPYIGKLIGLFIDMDTMIGSQFEAGLAELKAIGENPLTS